MKLLKNNTVIWFNKTSKQQDLNPNISNYKQKKVHQKSQDYTTRCEIPHQKVDQISIQKETTTKSTLIPAAFTRSRTQQTYVPTCPITNRGHVKQIHGKQI